ncbi:SGNH/GDSL hydrolase family protein [Aeromicrobium sp. P5_D10]
MGVDTIVRGAVAFGLAMSLAACSSGSAPDAVPEGTGSPTPRDMTTSYVAFGDSFTAGPGIAPQKSDAGYCQRSVANWPSLLAKTAEFDKFTDLSCSGATSADVLSTVSLAPLNAGTDLVTLGVGGNDGALFASLISACAKEGTACETFVDTQAPTILAKAVDSIVAVVEAIRARAPEAEIRLVGYLRIMPASGTCDAVGVPASQADRVASAEQALDHTLDTAAERAGIGYTSLLEASRGHDACAGDEAWTNGARPSDGDGIFFHPRQDGMRAVAKIVGSAVESAKSAES